MAEVELSNWSVGSISADPFKAPEQTSLRLDGVVKGHPRKRDGASIVTSPIVRADGRRVLTRSGTIYRLQGEPSPSYLAYLESIGRTYDAEQPIKVGRRG